MVKRFRKSRISSGVTWSISVSPNSWQKRSMTDRYDRTVFFFRMGGVVIDPDLCGFGHFHGLPPIG